MTRPRNPLRIALIGSGFMGRAHAMAFEAAARTFDLGAVPVLELLADRDAETAKRAGMDLGFKRSTGSWKEAVIDPAIDLVAITTPNNLHAPIALSAMNAGKAVYCEKPLATTITEARAMVAAAEEGGLATAVGFTYCFNPMISLARDLVASGELGEVTAFRGAHAEDFMSSPDTPFNWRCEGANAGGALADLGSHIIALAQHIVGPIDAVCGHLATFHKHRRGADGDLKRVAVDDQADAMVRFASGATGVLSATWLATGRKMGLGFEISGTKGAILFDQERLNELRVFRSSERRLEGFTRICAGPQHEDYGDFCPAPGHQLGYNDLKTIEARAAIEAAVGWPNASKSFRDALEVELVADAIRRSSNERRWVEVEYS